MNRSQFDEVNKYLDPRDVSDGLILHAATEMADGRIQVVDVYADEQSLQRAGRERIFPAFKKAGVFDMLMAAPAPEVAEVFELTLPAARVSTDS